MQFFCRRIAVSDFYLVVCVSGLGDAAVARGVSWAGSGFVWGGARLRGLLSIFRGFFWYWRGLHFGGVAGHWAIILWGLDSFLIFASLKSFRNSWGNSYIPCL